MNISTDLGLEFFNFLFPFYINRLLQFLPPEKPFYGENYMIRTQLRHRKMLIYRTHVHIRTTRLIVNLQ